MTDTIDPALLRRWRLILGAEAGQGLGSGGALGDPQDQRRDDALAYLYEREHRQRENDRSGGIGNFQPSPVHWLGEVRSLFPRSTAEYLQKEALERYHLHRLLADPEVLAQSTPSIELVQTLMQMRESLPPAILAEALRLIRRVAAQLEEAIAPRIRAAFSPRRKRHGHGGRPRLADLDWARTVRHNLRHYQPATQQLVLERLFFRPRETRHLTWQLWLLVDQSGSMCESVIHSAVMAGIFARLRTLQTRMLLFSDAVVDVSRQLDAPEQLLMGAQLGGGTNIAGALAHVNARLEQPARSVVILISDLYEGYSAEQTLREAARLTSSGVRVLALAALDRRANPDYDRAFARRLGALGVEVGAMTPDALVDWMAGVMSR